MKFVVAVTLTLTSLFFVIHGEIFTALATMKRALHIEKRLAHELRTYVPLISDEVRSTKVSE